MLIVSKCLLWGMQNISDYFVFQGTSFYLVTNQTTNYMHDVKYNITSGNYEIAPINSICDTCQH